MSKLTDFVDARNPPLKLHPVAPEAICVIKAVYPDLPEDYFEFLGRVGAGDFPPFRFWAKPESAKELGILETNVQHFVFFGMRYPDHYCGFDPRNSHRVLEYCLDPSYGIVDLDWGSFEEFILKNFAN